MEPSLLVTKLHVPAVRQAASQLMTRGDETVLSGQVTDQAALYGLLSRLRDLGLPLLGVEASQSERDKAGADAAAHDASECPRPGGRGPYCPPGQSSIPRLADVTGEFVRYNEAYKLGKVGERPSREERTLKTRSIGKVVLYYDTEEEAAADLVEKACARSIDLIRDLWRLEAPDECRVYVMTSWRQFLFDSAPAAQRIYLALTLPLRRARIQQVWDLAGGWTLHYGERHVVGIKPPRLLEQVDEDVRARVFVPREVDEAVQHNVCHELVHACSEHLRLPTWLHEGLAMVTVDRFAQKPTVKAETLDALSTGSKENMARQSGYGQAGLDSLLSLAVRGYWITRYLAEAHPALLARQLAQHQTHAELESAVAAGLAMNREEFWRRIDGIVLSHLENSLFRRGS